MRTPFSILARIARWIVAIPPTLGIVSARAAEPAPSPGIEIARSDRTDPVDFYREVVPILQVNCLPCHNKTTTKADLLLETPADMLKGGESGPAVVPGKSSDSLLLQLAAHRQKPRMPPKDNKVNAVNLSPQDLGLLALWIDQGAKTTGHAEERITWKPLPAGLTPILSVAVAPDGQFAAAGRGNRIDLYHLPTGTWVGSLTDPALESGAHRDWVNALAFSPDGRTLASGGFREIKIWTQETPQWKPAAIPATAVVGTNGSWRSPDGLRVATQGTNGAVILSDGSGTRIAELRIHPEEKLALTRARADVDRSRRTQEREKARLEAAEPDAIAERWFDETAARLAALPPPPPIQPPAAPPPLRFRIDRGERTYLDDVARIHQHLLDGETYEICLTTQIRAARAGLDPLALHRLLRRSNPAPYGAFLRFPACTIVSASPERFVHISADGAVESRPIKGTRPRGRTPDEDARLAADLATAEKDHAENLMIVDLVRNDLGRVCVPGSVRAPRLMEVEAHPSVFQLVSTVRGQLAAGVTPVEAVRALFPGGSMTGAPKIRSMRIIAELERAPRGLYSGGLGFFSSRGAVDLAMTIRTIVIAGDELSFGVGGAVVALSEARAEYEEALAKGRALMRAIRAARGEPPDEGERPD